MSLAERLFVYGTLRPGFAPPALRSTVATLRSLGAARVRGTLHDLGAYPGAILDAAADGFVRGEVVELSATSPPLQWFDDYEGAGFRRVYTDAAFGDGRVVSCWIYVLVGEPGRASRIEGGEWNAGGA